MERVDTWIGRTLFVPLIVRFCQKSGVSQYTLSRVCWFIVFLTYLYAAGAWGEKVFFGLLSLFACLNAGLSSPTSPEISWRWFRIFVAGFFVLLLPAAIFGEGPLWRVAVQLLVLVAEYAATIRTIPPLEVKENRRQATVAKAEAA